MPNIDNYMNECKENGTVPLFKGHEPFEHLLNQRRIMPYVAVIRVRAYNQPIDSHYELNDDGQLEFVPARGQEARPGSFDAKEILSLENSPDGWEIEHLAPVRKIKKIKK